MDLLKTSTFERYLRLLLPSEISFLQTVKDRKAAWIPQSKPQALALLSRAFETLYGGAAGGGKSDLLLGIAREMHSKSVIFRREYPDLERSVIPRSKEFYGDPSLYNESKHRWHIDNRSIWFSHLERHESVFAHQSAQYDLIGFDELTQFSKSQYEYMLSRARTTRKGQRVRVMACTNPGGSGNDWVMERWAAWLDETHPNPALPGELRWYKRGQDGIEVETTADDPDGVSRTFVPAKLIDNPYLGDDYRRTLNLLPEPIRSQLLHGDWRAGLTDDAYQVIPRAWVKAAMDRWQPQENPGAPDVVGTDVAHGGQDQTVFAPRHKDWFAPLQKHAGRTTPDGQSVVGLLSLLLVNGGRGNIDVIGVGASAYDIAKETLRVLPVNFAARTDATDRSGQLHFMNVRAELYWRLREALDPNSGRNIQLPPDPELLGDLIAPRWSMTTSGIKIEDKDAIKDRLGRSPDSGDAVVLAMWEAPWLLA